MLLYRSLAILQFSVLGSQFSAVKPRGSQG
jgi:hypothetical protein